MGWAVFVGRSAAIIGLHVHAAVSSQQRGAWTQLVTAPGGAMVLSRPLPSPIGPLTRCSSASRPDASPLPGKPLRV